MLELYFNAKKKYMVKDLTKAEEQIMQILWKLENAFVREIIEFIPVPKPAYNTVSTIVRILERKGFVSYTAYGKSHQYFPLISKKEYTRRFMKGFVTNYFSNSFRDMVSFFAKEEKLSLSDLEEVKKMVEDQIKISKLNDK